MSDMKFIARKANKFKTSELKQTKFPSGKIGDKL